MKHALLSLSLAIFSCGCAFSHRSDTVASTRETDALATGWTVCAKGETPQKVDVPHCWNVVDGADGGSQETASADGTGYWRGEKTYTRALKMNPKEGKRYFIRCEGASSKANVWVNGQKVGEHLGAFGAFCFEITPYLKSVKNELEIKVDNSFDSNLPPVSGDFTVYGGLYRPVTLIETNNACINPANAFATHGARFTQTALTDTAGTLSVDIDLAGISEKSELKVTVQDGGDKVVATQIMSLTPAQSLAKLEMTVPNPVRWDGIKNPYLYEVEVSLWVDGKQVDKVEQKWGFRTMEIDPKRGFVLNGKAMRLNGVNRHQDKEGKGWALSDKDHEEDVKMMREMGVDAWRAAHYPHAEKMYTLCDEAGIVVWAEIPIVDRVNETDSFFANSELQLREMISQHRNHPSIAMWSISNELGNGPNGQKCKGSAKLTKTLYDISRELDPTRPCVLAACLQRKDNEIADHIGFNTYPGWYGGNAKAMGSAISSWCKKYPAKGICVAEYGAGASINCHEFPLKQPRTIHPFHPEEWQTYCHEHQYRAIKNASPQLWGSFVWNMFDFGADNRKEGDHMGRNDKGLVTFDRRTRKDAFYLYQANWTDKPMVHLTASRFAKRPESAAKMPFQVFSNCESVELFLNGKSLGRQTPDDLKIFRWDNQNLKKGHYMVKAVGKSKNSSVSDSYAFEISGN